MPKFIKIAGSNEHFEVNNIYCIGKNYLDHIKEFGQTSAPEKPVVFLKPNSAIIGDGESINIPVWEGKPISNSVHYETELVVAIGKNGSKIPENEAEEFIFGYAIGLDMTLRDVQSEAKKSGLPWTAAKGFHSSAPISNIIRADKKINPMDLNLKLEINGIEKQHGNTSLMLFNICKLISYISSIFYIQKGDLIFTGTPEGVGEVIRGDNLHAVLGNNLLNLKVKVDG
ncbi:MAG: fumarylacetoacetate hydrolase family protein [Ignavibacteria bacterium]|nr:fumarylacetoacetate hydrolase family protein [Ignavibacteria bacterium]